MENVLMVDANMRLARLERLLDATEARIADLERLTEQMRQDIAALSKPDPVSAAHERLERAAFDVLVELDKIKSGS